MADRYNLTYSGEQVNTAIGRGLTSLQPTAQTLSDIQKQTVRTNIGAMGALNVYNPNLLINGDFTINQRGASSYTTTGTSYTCDRLVHYGANAYTLTPITTGGVTINASGGIADFAQVIEDGATKYGGKAMTLSISVSGTIYSVSGTPVKGTLSSFAGSFPNCKFYLEWTSSDIFKAWFRVTSGATVTINWWKLELGSIATPFVPPLTAEELPKCQRYGIPIRLHGGANYATSTTSILCGIPLPSTLRTTPTITVSTQPTVGGNGSTYTVTNTTVNSVYSNEVILAITTSGITANEIYALQGGMAFLDAEIY